MNNKKKTLGLTIATTAAIAFATAPVTSSIVYAADNVLCYGVNNCKGQSECQTATSTCNGNNACKGRGYLIKTESECKKMGGSLKNPM